MQLVNKNFCLILGCTINPNQVQNLERKSPLTRLEDYKISLIKWLKNNATNKILVVENSGYDLSELKKVANDFKKTKKIEFLSIDTNNYFSPELGKGYGESLILKEAAESSTLLKESESFIHVSGRYYIKNFKNYLNEFDLSEADVFLNLSDNLKYCSANIYAGKKDFLLKYVIPESEKVNDSKNYFFENCIASAALKAILDNYSFQIPETYPIIEGTIGTNNKEYNFNLIKKIELKIFGKIKKFFFETKKY